MVNNKKQLLEIIKESLTELYEKDKDLFEKNSGKGICERALVFRFAYYLQNNIISKNRSFVVDCDYNSNCLNSGKPIPDGDKSIKRFIDIIVHIRGNNENNWCAIECKKWNSRKTEKDENNLKELTKQNENYKYKYGLFIVFKKDSKADLCIYENSEAELYIFKNRDIFKL